MSYHLVSGAGDGNNSLFTLETNGTLKTATVFDYETNASTSSRTNTTPRWKATSVMLNDVSEFPAGASNFQKSVIRTDSICPFCRWRDVDVLSASIVSPNGGISWYKNDGQQNFTEIVIDSNGQESVVASDFDGDGDIDVSPVGGRPFHGTKIMVGIFSKHAGVHNGARRAFVLDINQDGYQDILVASVSDQTISWYENNGSGGLAQRIVTSSASGVKDIRAVDLDQDGDIDVISACISSDSIHWHENLGTQNFVTHTISNTADGAHGVDYVDFDGDGFIDIVSASLADNTIALYSNDGSQNFTKLVLSNTIISPWVVTTAPACGSQWRDHRPLKMMGNQFNPNGVMYMPRT